MTEGAFRLIIIIFGIIWTTGFLLALVMLFYLYRKMSVLQQSTNETVLEMRKLIVESQEILKPLLQIKAIIEAVYSGIGIVKKIADMKKGGKENEQ